MGVKSTTTRTASPAEIVVKNVVVVGDGACGKTSLLFVFSQDEFPVDHTPTVFETYVADIVVDERPVALVLWDTAGQEDYDRLRPLSYPFADVVIICYSVDSRDSFENVVNKWSPEVAHFCPGVPVVLVATKTDLRHDDETVATLAKKGERPITTEEGAALARKLWSFAFVECSSKKREGIDDVFREAALGSLRAKKKTSRKCTIL